MSVNRKWSGVNRKEVVKGLRDSGKRLCLNSKLDLQASRAGAMPELSFKHKPFRAPAKASGEVWGSRPATCRIFALEFFNASSASSILGAYAPMCVCDRCYSFDRQRLHKREANRDDSDTRTLCSARQEFSGAEPGRTCRIGLGAQ